MKSLLVGISAAICFISVNTFALDSEVEISGFADFFYQVKHGEGMSDDFHFGQVEIDVETVLAEKVNVSAAIAVDGWEIFSLSVLTAELPLWGTQGPHFLRGGIDHCGLIVGQFYVPFGIDWRAYPSPDRRLLTTPLVVELTHGAWKDLGVQANLCHKKVNLAMMMTGSFNYLFISYWRPDRTVIGYMSERINLGGYHYTDNTVAVWNPRSMKSGVGGRLSFQPWVGLEVGAILRRLHQ